MTRLKNRLNEQFAVRVIAMLESPAYRALTLSGHKVLARLEIELAHHGGNDNGELPVTYQNFIDFGITRECIAPALREVVALGFVEITRHGRGGNAEFREPNLYRITYAHARDSRQRPPTNDWRAIKTQDEADSIASEARHQNGNRYGKPTPKPVRKTHTETEKFSVRKTRTTGSVRKPVLLSISGVRGSVPAPTSPSVDVLTQTAARKSTERS
jgi:hypothetical protein